jgi:hypothetical protein
LEKAMAEKQGRRETAVLSGARTRALAASGFLHLLMMAALIHFSFSSPAPAAPPQGPGFSVELVQAGELAQPRTGDGRAKTIPDSRPDLPRLAARAGGELTPMPIRSVLKRPTIGADSAIVADAAPVRTPEAQPPAVLASVQKPRLQSAKPAGASAVPDLDAQLHALARQQQDQAGQNPPDTGTALAADGGGSFNSATVYRARDFIRAQIERRWYLDRAALVAGGFLVSLHLELGSDGRVMVAEIDDAGGLADNAAYRSAAASLRAAALLSSPLVLPEGQYEAVKDVDLVFRSNDVLQ